MIVDMSMGSVVLRLVLVNMICGDLLLSLSVIGMWFLVVICVISLLVVGEFVNEMWLMFGWWVSVVFVLWL